MSVIYRLRAQSRCSSTLHSIDATFLCARRESNAIVCSRRQRPLTVFESASRLSLWGRKELWGSYRTFSANPVDVDARDNDLHLDDVELSSDRKAPQPTIEEQYSRKTPLEHVLLRPGMYVGPNERLPPTSVWVVDPLPLPPKLDLVQDLHHHPVPVQNDGTEALDTVLQSMRMVKKEYGLVPALIKVFDEILVNASDNSLRHPKSCSRIDVVIDPGSSIEQREPFIRVWNDGKGIPIHVHATEKMYIPEMLFGHLLTGSNFDDTEKRLTGGRHGYGAKLANIFAQRFTVETVDAKKKLKYRQTWSNNMSVVGAPAITALASGEGEFDYTCVEFVPDLPRLIGEENASEIAEADYAVMCRRVVDVAGCAAASGTLKVTLNGRDVTQQSFADYTQMYRSTEASPMCFVKLNPRWTVGVGRSESGSFESVSFVNGMATPRGGTHVNVLVQQIVKSIQETLDKHDSELGTLVTPAMIRRCLHVVCDTKIENPTFDSQMKENLTSSPLSFGSQYTFTKTFLKKVVIIEEEGGPGILEALLRVARGQQAALLKDIGGKKNKRPFLSIPKLEDAHKAGTGMGEACTLILTEGDSAKSLAVAGLEVIGRDKFGVFPLRGKLLNVRDAPIAKLANNAEVKALCSILGLDFGKTYETYEERREMRYGRVLLMTDQDTGTFVQHSRTILFDSSILNMYYQTDRT